MVGKGLRTGLSLYPCNRFGGQVIELRTKDTKKIFFKCVNNIQNVSGTCGFYYYEAAYRTFLGEHYPTDEIVNTPPPPVMGSASSTSVRLAPTSARSTEFTAHGNPPRTAASVHQRTGTSNFNQPGAPFMVNLDGCFQSVADHDFVRRAELTQNMEQMKRQIEHDTHETYGYMADHDFVRRAELTQKMKELKRQIEHDTHETYGYIHEAAPRGVPLAKLSDLQDLAKERDSQYAALNSILLKVQSETDEYNRTSYRRDSVVSLFAIVMIVLLYTGLNKLFAK